MEVDHNTSLVKRSSSTPLHRGDPLHAPIHRGEEGDPGREREREEIRLEDTAIGDQGESYIDDQYGS